jgi:Domain of unknown function DUF1828
MNCTEMSSITGYACSPVHGGLCIQTPHALHDGSGVSVFVFEENSLCFVTDEGLTLFNVLSSSGAISDQAKQQRSAIARICKDCGVHLGEAGEIHMYSKPSQLTQSFYLVTEAIQKIGQWQRKQAERSNDALLEDVQALLAAWRPDKPILEKPKIVGSTGKTYEFNFEQGGELIDAIPSTAQAGAAMAHKLLDVRNLVENSGAFIRIVLDDIDAPSKQVQREGQVLGSLATITNLSVLRQLGARNALH